MRYNHRDFQSVFRGGLFGRHLLVIMSAFRFILPKNNKSTTSGYSASVGEKRKEINDNPNNTNVNNVLYLNVCAVPAIEKNVHLSSSTTPSCERPIIEYSNNSSQMPNFPSFQNVEKPLEKSQKINSSSGCENFIRLVEVTILTKGLSCENYNFASKNRKGAQRTR